MKVAVVLIAVIASVNCGSIRVVRQSGWPAPTTTPGWSSPPTQGWGPSGVLTNIELNGALAAAGSGWAAENHNEAVQVQGAGGWGPAADIVISAGGESVVDQAGSILQVTSQDNQQASSLNNISVSQQAEGIESEVVDAVGLEISNAQNGWAAATGEGSSAAEGTSSILVNPASLGVARP